MDFVEVIQKLTYWVGALPYIHKTVLSLIFAGICLFVILLIWSPPPSKTELVLDVVVDSSGAAAGAARKLSERLNTPTTNDALKSRIEKKKLNRLLSKLIESEISKAPIPGLLREYVRSGDPSDWHTVTLEIKRNSLIISDLIELLENFDGDLVHKDMETYRELRYIINSRARRFEQLKPDLNSNLDTSSPPGTQREKDQLLKIAENFETLINQMKSIEIKLRDYLIN